MNDRSGCQYRSPSVQIPPWASERPQSERSSHRRFPEKKWMHKVETWSASSSLETNPEKAKKNQKNTETSKQRKHALVVHNRRRAHHLVHLRVALPPQLRNVPLPPLNDALQARRDAAADVSDRLEPRHLVADRRRAREEVRLVRAEPLGVERHRLREGGELRGQLRVHLLVQAQQLRVRRAGWRNSCSWGRGCGRGRATDAEVIIFRVEEIRRRHGWWCWLWRRRVPWSWR